MSQIRIITFIDVANSYHNIHRINTFYFVICKIVVTFVPMTKESIPYIDISTSQSLQPNKYNVKSWT